MKKCSTPADELIELLAAAIEGIDGYEAEMGDIGRYWDAGKITRAREVIDSATGGPPAWRGPLASLSGTPTPP